MFDYQSRILSPAEVRACTRPLTVDEAAYVATLTLRINAALLEAGRAAYVSVPVNESRCGVAVQTALRRAMPDWAVTFYPKMGDNDHSTIEIKRSDGEPIASVG